MAHRGGGLAPRISCLFLTLTLLWDAFPPPPHLSQYPEEAHEVSNSQFFPIQRAGVAASAPGPGAAQGQLRPLRLEASGGAGWSSIRILRAVGPASSPGEGCPLRSQCSRPCGSAPRPSHPQPRPGRADRPSRAPSTRCLWTLFVH